MKKSNIMSASALFLGIGLTVATSAFKPASNQDTDIWGRDANGMYTNITQQGLIENQDYSCEESDDPCKLEYPVGQNPNLNPTGGVQVGANGEFVLTP